MKKLILSGLLFLGVLSAQAQAQQGERTEYVFNPHWYVQVQPLGIQHTLGEIDFGDLNSYNIQAGVGYNFDKILGARLSVNAWQSKAGITNKSWKLANEPEFYSKWSWNYVAPSIELTANLSNALFGYNPERLFSLSAFVGVGLNIGFSNDDAAKVRDSYNNFIASKNPNLTTFSSDQNMQYLWSGTKVRMTGRAGLAGDFRINEKFSAGIEVNANLTSDRYNSKRAGNADWYFNALAGIKYNLGKTHTTRVIPAPEPEIRYVEKIVEKRVEVPTNTGGAMMMNDDKEPLRRDIFFLINKTNVRDTEKQKVIDIANYLKENPEAKVVMTGYADKGTGNARINARLAKLRSESVRNMLMKEFGIPASRITYDSKGDTEQPFAENDKNRVTVCIAE